MREAWEWRDELGYSADKVGMSQEGAVQESLVKIHYLQSHFSVFLMCIIIAANNSSALISIFLELI